jgi:DNA-3-methyladenine glycosylase II
VEIALVEPFRLDLTVWTLRRRAHNAVDSWDGNSYRRVVESGGRAIEVAVRQERRRRSSVLVVELRRHRGEPDETAIRFVRQLLARTLGLDTEIWDFYALAERDDRLATLAQRFAGMRPPRFPSVFEGLVNAIACQQLSLDVGVHLLNRLATHYGRRVEEQGQAGFPAPERLAEVDTGELRLLGFSRAKATAIVSMAQRVVDGSVDLEGLAELDDGEARAALISLPGIGRWSAEYALLRCLGRLEVLPGDDVGARNRLSRRFGLAADAGYDEVQALSQTWWPYAGLVYFHLLLDGLAGAGHIDVAFDGEQQANATWPPLSPTADAGGEVA